MVPLGDMSRKVLASEAGQNIMPFRSDVGPFSTALQFGPLTALVAPQRRAQ